MAEMAEIINPHMEPLRNNLSPAEMAEMAEISYAAINSWVKNFRDFCDFCGTTK